MADALGAADALGEEALLTALRPGQFGRPLRYLPSSASTNDLARAWAAEGAPEGAAVVVDHQTSGRGREGRAWICPPHIGLLLSVVLRPQCPASALGAIALIAGIAIARAVKETTGVVVRLKWPNDIIAAGKKAGGVLVESESRGGRVLWAVVGCGLNVNGTRDDFPSELRPAVTTLAEQAGHGLSRAVLFGHLLGQLESIYTQFTSKGVAWVLDQWRALAWTGTELAGGGQRRA